MGGGGEGFLSSALLQRIVGLRKKDFFELGFSFFSYSAASEVNFWCLNIQLLRSSKDGVRN